jgi:D-arabinose 1-dehydrogenase-like Zn-dependent alcohol dehydrogenase
VEMLCHTDELLTSAQGEVVQVREMLKTAEERVVKAEARSDLLASAYATLDAGRTTGRR